MNKIVYTCITGNYDTLRDPEIINPKWKYILFTDQPVQSKIWEIRPLAAPKTFTNTIKIARWHKTNAPGLFGPGCLVIWHDGNMCMRVDPEAFANENLPKGYSLAAVRHPERTCIYQEAEAVVKLKKDVPDAVEKQVAHLKAEGMPEGFGMTETGILLYKTTEKVTEFMRLWWNEIDAYSHRDQLSFDFIRWKINMRIHYFGSDIKKNVFQIIKHPRKIPAGYDVVYVLGRGSKWDNNEIRYSIRSVKQYFKDLRNIVIVGDMPPWAINVVHIPWPDNHSHTKDQIMIEKIMQACHDIRVSDRFLFACDDKIMLGPCEFKDFNGWHDGPIRDIEKPTSWHRGLYRTREVLKQTGNSINDFNSPHAFQPIDKKEFIQVMGYFHWQKDNIYGASVYGNLTRIFTGSRSDKHAKIRGKNSYLSILRQLDGKITMNYNDPALNDALRDTLAILFPDRSECERYGTESGAWTEYQEWLATGKDFDRGVNLVRRHTNNRRLVIFFERKGNNVVTQKILERNLNIISRKWENLKIG